MTSSLPGVTEASAASCVPSAAFDARRWTWQEALTGALSLALAASPALPWHHIAFAGCPPARGFVCLASVTGTVSGVTGHAFLAGYILAPNPHHLPVEPLPPPLLTVALRWGAFAALFVAAVAVIAAVLNLADTCGSAHYDPDEPHIRTAKGRHAVEAKPIATCERD